jgi:hypothetical protein
MDSEGLQSGPLWKLPDRGLLDIDILLLELDIKLVQ